MSTSYQITDSTVTVVVANRLHVVPRSDTVKAEAVIALLAADLTDAEREERLVDILSPAAKIAEAVDGTRVTVVGNRVLFDGENLPSALTRKVIEVVRAGLPIDPWQRFVVRLFANPSRGAQAELNEFLEAGNLPITDDGCFLAYKRVTDDYKDLHSRTFDNSVGQIVEMERQAVDPDRDRTCSYGLHFCSQDYLRHFYSGSGRIVIVKVNPTDVVSIPSDYQFTKGRTCRYEVVGEVDLSAEGAKAEWGVYDNTFTSLPDDAEWDDPLGWDAPEEDEFYCHDCGDEITEYEADMLDSLCEECYEENVARSEEAEPEEDGVVEPPPFTGSAPVQPAPPVEDKVSKFARLRAKFRS